MKFNILAVFACMSSVWAASVVKVGGEVQEAEGWFEGVYDEALEVLCDEEDEEGWFLMMASSRTSAALEVRRGEMQYAGQMGVGSSAGYVLVSGGRYVSVGNGFNEAKMGVGNAESGGRMEVEVRGGVWEQQGLVGASGADGAGGQARVLVSGGSVVNSGRMGVGAEGSGELELVISGGEFRNGEKGVLGYGSGGERAVGKGAVRVQLSGGRLVNEGIMGGAGAAGGEGSYAGSGRAEIEVSGGEFVNRGWLGYGEDAVYGDGGIGDGGFKGEVRIAVSGGVFRHEGGVLGYADGGGEARGVVLVSGSGRLVHAGGEYGYGAEGSLVEVEVAGRGVYDMGGCVSREHVTMRGGCLEAAGGHAGGVLVETAAGFSGEVKLGGLDGACVEAIRAGRGVSLSGVKRGSRLELSGSDNYMYVGGEHLAWEGEEARQAMIGFDGGEGELSFAEGGRLELRLGAQDIMEGWRGGKEVRLEIWLTNGEVRVEELREHLVLGTGWELWVEGGKVGDGRAGGVLELGGTLAGVWFSSDYAGRESEAPYFDEYRKVVIDEDIELAWEGGVRTVMKQVEGSGRLRVERREGTEGALTLEAHNSDEEGRFGYTYMGGEISLGDGVELEKTGGARLELGGGLEAQGEVRVREGELALSAGTRNRVGRLEVAGSKAQLGLEGELEVAQGGRIGEGRVSGQGVMRVSGGRMEVGREGSMDGPWVDVAGGAELVVEAAACRVGGLSGAGSVELSGGQMRVSGVSESAEAPEARFEGQLLGAGHIEVEQGARQRLSSPGNGAYRLSVAAGGVLELQGRAEGECRYGELSVAAGGELELVASGGGEAGGARIGTEGGVRLGAGATLGLTFDARGLGSGESGRAMMLRAGGAVSIGEGVLIRLNTLQGEEGQAALPAGNLEHLAVVEAERIENEGSGRLRVYRDGLFYLCYSQVELSIGEDGRTLYLDAVRRAQDENPLYEGALTPNARAGADLLAGELGTGGGAMAQVQERLGELLRQGRRREAASLLAGVAGSASTAMGAAMAEAMQARLGQLRMRIGNGYGLSGEFEAGVAGRVRPQMRSRIRVESTGSSRRLDGRGDEAGYTHSVWGGSVGIEVETAQRRTQVGLELSAEYGRLSSRSSAGAAGRFTARPDEVSLGLYARHTSRRGRLQHTLLAQVGRYEATMRREVHYGTGSYSASGKVSGSSMALGYEVARPVQLRRSRLVPYVGLSLSSLSPSAYSESGAGALALHIAPQAQKRMMLRAGSYWEKECSIGQRRVGITLHGGLEAEAGDMRSEARVRLAHPTADSPHRSATVRSAAAPALHGLLHAGIRLPLNTRTSLHIDTATRYTPHAPTITATLSLHYTF